MFLDAPTTTAYDLRFKIAGIPIRVSPWFFLMAVLLGSNNEDPSHLLLWVIAVFLSVLIHELGHSIAFRFFGIDSQIVLYQFGGLAIPTGSLGFATRGRSASRYQSIVISAAGPAAQILAALVLMVGIAASGFIVPFSGFPANWLYRPGATMIPSERLFLFCFDFLSVSIYWAILNLMPVLPMDGGQIARELFLIWDRSSPIKHSLMLSVVTAGVCALYALKQEQMYLGIMFGMLGYSSYVALQAHTGSGNGFGRRWN